MATLYIPQVHHCIRGSIKGQQLSIKSGILSFAKRSIAEFPARIQMLGSGDEMRPAVIQEDRHVSWPAVGLKDKYQRLTGEQQPKIGFKEAPTLEVAKWHQGEESVLWKAAGL